MQFLIRWVNSTFVHLPIWKFIALLVDAEMAFDHIHCPFLEATLTHLQLGDVLISKVMALYTLPTARVRVNGQLSEPFLDM